MTDAKPPALFDWATELSDAQGHVTLSEQEAHEIGARLRRQHTENEALQAGYAAARLEIESLKSQIANHADELMVAHLDGRMRAAQQEAQDLDAVCAELEITDSERTQQPVNDEVVFIDGVGAGRSSIKSCRDGVQWIRVGDHVYWPLSDSDAKRLHSACCGNGSFDGPRRAVEGEQQ